MRILYGIVGEGMGHATRSRVVLEHLLEQGHQVYVVVSGRAHRMIADGFAERDNIQVKEIHGLQIAFQDNAVHRAKTVWNILKGAPKGTLHNIQAYRQLMDLDFKPEVVISDFESWAYFFALNHRLPLISIDNMQIINRCAHPSYSTANHSLDYRLTRQIVKYKLPRAYHYLISSFFFPPVAKKRTTLLPPLLRPEVLAAKREPGKHILVYSSSISSMPDLLPTLQQLPYEFRVYCTGQTGIRGNVTLRAFSEQGFIDDLRTARAVIGGGGFSFMSEAVHLRVPMLSIPIQGQFEQEMNARYLEQLGYGDWSCTLDAQLIKDFLRNTTRFSQSLAKYQPQDNAMFFRCIDELLYAISLDEPCMDRLESPALGKYCGTPLPDEGFSVQGVPTFKNA